MSNILRLATDSMHGGVLKIMSLFARLAFFVLIVPNLADGELAVYVYISSTAVLVSMILVFGLDEELPRVVAGNVETARHLRLLFLVVNLISVILLAVLMLKPSVTLGVIVFSVVIASTGYLAGIIRGLDAAIYERLCNLPWIIFIGIVLGFQYTDAISLIIVMGSSVVVVQWYCLAAMKIHGRTKEFVDNSYKIRLLRDGVINGFPRLLSNLLFLATIRGALLWPVWLSMDVELDQIALAIAVGEVVAQFGLIPVNRAYVRWCKSPPVLMSDWREAQISSAVVTGALVVLSGAGLLVTMYLGLLPPQATDLQVFIQALFYYSLVPAFRLTRYFLWVKAPHNYWVVGVSFVQFSISIAIFVLIPTAYWFLYLSLLLVIVCVAFGIKSRGDYRKIADIGG